MNCHWKAMGWNSNNQTMIKPLILEYNGDMDKFYRKRLLVKEGKFLNFCNEIKLPKPPKHIIIEYEKLKKEFTTDLYKKIGDKIEGQEYKESLKNHIQLTQQAEKILNWLKEGKTKRETAELADCSIRNVEAHITRFRRMGIKIQPEYNKAEGYSGRYIVIDSSESEQRLP